MLQKSATNIVQSTIHCFLIVDERNKEKREKKRKKEERTKTQKLKTKNSRGAPTKERVPNKKKKKKSVGRIQR